jgi:hypothetical protein
VTAMPGGPSFSGRPARRRPLISVASHGVVHSFTGSVVATLVNPRRVGAGGGHDHVRKRRAGHGARRRDSRLGRLCASDLLDRINAATGNRCSGGNVLALCLAAADHHHPTARWTTCEQWSPSVPTSARASTAPSPSSGSSPTNTVKVRAQGAAVAGFGRLGVVVVGGVGVATGRSATTSSCRTSTRSTRCGHLRHPRP